MRNRGWAAAGATAGAGGLMLVLAACGSSGSNMSAGSAYGGSSMSSPTASAMSGAGSTNGMGATTTAMLTIKTTTIGKVLTNAQGYTLYTYAKDTKDGPSTCTGGCLKEWPLVKGKAVVAMGVKLAGDLGTVTDANGTMQATYDGMPLYLYAGDMAPGQTAGNGAGGLWHVITGSTLTASSSGGGMMATPAASKTSSMMGGSSGGSGSGYGTGTRVSSGSSSSGSSGSSGNSGGSGSSGSSGSAGNAAAPSTKQSSAPAAAPTTPAAPAPAPTTTYPGCGEGACW